MFTVNVVLGIFLGHLLGDYVLQNNWMALAKNRSTFRCLVHCLVYTAAVGALTSWRPAWLAVVFLSHFPIDRWNLGEAWLRLIGGRSLGEFLRHGRDEIPAGLDADNYRALRGGFTALVYAAVDNTFHLGFMIGGWWLLDRW
jgi:Protein of unknown function (DUF3307)